MHILLPNWSRKVAFWSIPAGNIRSHQGKNQGRSGKQPSGPVLVLTRSSLSPKFRRGAFILFKMRRLAPDFPPKIKWNKIEIKTPEEGPPVLLPGPSVPSGALQQTRGRNRVWTRQDSPHWLLSAPRRSGGESGQCAPRGGCRHGGTPPPAGRAQNNTHKTTGLQMLGCFNSSMFTADQLKSSMVVAETH